MPFKYRKGRKVVKCVSCVSLLSQDFTLLKILSLFLFSVPHHFYFLSLFLHSLSRSTSVQSVLFSTSRPNSRRKDVFFFYALRTSGKILLSKHLSIIRAALLTFELSNPSGRIKIVYTKTFIHSFVFLQHLLCR